MKLHHHVAGVSRTYLTLTFSGLKVSAALAAALSPIAIGLVYEQMRDPHQFVFEGLFSLAIQSPWRRILALSVIMAIGTAFGCIATFARESTIKLRFKQAMAKRTTQISLISLTSASIVFYTFLYLEQHPPMGLDVLLAFLNAFFWEAAFLWVLLPHRETQEAPSRSDSD